MFILSNLLHRTFDYAYGLTYCLELAAGNFDRTCMTDRLEQKAGSKKQKKLCPIVNGREICPGENTANNADTYAFVAAGVWFSTQCKTAIAIPPPATSRIKSRNTIVSRQSSCPADSDIILSDGAIPVGTYAHFGDSYAAGMGTGTTSGDKCRVGSNNFGRLIYTYMADTNINYDEKVCSGDSLTGLSNQINSWSTASDTSIATLSVGGNDIGFADLYWYCVTTPNTIRFGSTNRANCVAAENKAREYMSDVGPTGLRYNLKEAYLSILNKADHDVRSPKCSVCLILTNYHSISISMSPVTSPFSTKIQQTVL